MLHYVTLVKYRVYVTILLLTGFWFCKMLLTFSGQDISYASWTG